MIHHGDCLTVLRSLLDCSVDACVTDPPYELGFMGKAWDGSGIANSVDLWREVLRTLRPGAYLLSFGGTRTYHRMACAIEDAGFEVRDCLAWMYGQGFPKSLNLGDGRGTALKPSFEPVVMARKPFKGTVAGNVTAFGTGALNVDACRLAPMSKDDPSRRGLGYGFTQPGSAGTGVFSADVQSQYDDSKGRWPANILLDEEAAAMLDEQSGETQSASGEQKYSRAETTSWVDRGGSFTPGREWSAVGHGDSGGASRFFYVAKPSREERDMGCEGLTARTGGECTDRKDGSAGLNNPRAGAGRTGGGRNTHPTVKPVELMRWLVRLVTPPGGTVLDPFMGSGTTGMACRYEMREFIGIEREAEYIAIAERRIASVAPLFNEPAAEKPADEGPEQGSLLESA